MTAGQSQHQGAGKDTIRMCNLYSITTNQAAIIALFRVVNRYVGNPLWRLALPPIKT